MASSSTPVTSFETELVEFIRARGRSTTQYHPCPSYVNAASFVSIKLSSDANYGPWKEQMMCLVECHGMLGFINGKLKGPVEDDEEAASEWKRSDTLVKGWIFGSLSEEVMQTVVGLQTANDVWEKLNATYTNTIPSPPEPPTSSTINIETTTITEKESIDKAEYLPLYRAVARHDWGKAQEIFNQDKDALTAKISYMGESALHLAIVKMEDVQFLKNLLEEITPELLTTLVDNLQYNPLHIAASYDNKMAVEMLVEKNPHLLFLYTTKELLPIHIAISNSHETTFRYLLGACQQHIHLSQQVGYHSPFDVKNGAELLARAISTGYLDVANELILNYPYIATEKSLRRFPLSYIAGKRDAYYSGETYNYYQRFVYFCVPTEINHLLDANEIQDIENQDANLKSCFYSVFQRIYAKIWRFLVIHVLHIKHLHKEKVKHLEALLLLKRVCEEVGKLEELSIREHYTDAVDLALLNDTPEAIEEIVKYFPDALWTWTNGYNLMQVAITNRCEKVYKFLVCYQSLDRHRYREQIDKDGNNLLHLAGQLAPLHKLNLVSGAALQMQRELQWFQDVERFVKPNYKEHKNRKGETPIMVFRNGHKELRKEGEEWLKKTADSYTITAALTITIVFAAAITVPGGNDDSGKAVYETEPSFIIFAVSDAISLFTSTTSLLLFLSILTARYREEDFLYKLPKRLILGLAMLFLSISSMMVAFSATLYLMFGQGRAWILIPIATLTCLPIASFVTLQLPLLVDLISSTYGHGIFAK